MRLLLNFLSPLIGLLSFLIPKTQNRLVFLVEEHHRVSGNLFALVHHVLVNTELDVVMLDNTGASLNITWHRLLRVVKSGTWSAFWLRMTSNNYVVTHGFNMLFQQYRFVPGTRVFNLWHGVPIKSIGNLDHSFSNKKRKKLYREATRTTVQFVSSELDRTFIAGCNLISGEALCPSGMPRIDFLMAEEKLLPSVLQEQLSSLKSVLGNRKLVLYAPTFRDYDRMSVGFQRDELKAFSEMLEQKGCVLGVRPHPKDKKLYLDLIEGLNVIDLSSDVVPEVQVVLRQADVLITDYSGIWIDYLVTKKPIVTYLWDYTVYESSRSFLVDFDAVFPGENFFSFEDLFEAFEKNTDFDVGEKYEIARKVFFKNVDNENCRRALEVIVSTCKMDVTL